MDLSDLLGKLGYLSGDHDRWRKEGSRKLRGEDIVRVARLLGVNLTRLSELLGENVKLRADVSFGNGPPSEDSTAETSSEEPPGDRSRKGAKRPPGG